MKKWAASFLVCASLGLGSNLQAKDKQTELELEAMAMTQLIASMDESERMQLGALGLGDAIKDALAKLEEIKQQILDQFDTNGNGRIDPGAELDSFKETIQSIVMLLVDSNQNAKIDAEDIKVLTEFLLNKIQEQAKAQVCPVVIAEAEKAGPWLKFRPLLKQMYQLCLAE